MQTIKTLNPSFESAHFKLSYQEVYLHNGSGTALLMQNATGHDLAFGFDGQYRNTWDPSPARVTRVSHQSDYTDIEIETGLIQKIDRIYKNVPLLEIIYQRNDSDWTEDFIRAEGRESEICFVMYGMKDVKGFGEGQALWKKSEQLCGHNYGDCFIEANASTLTQCLYKGHFIYGFLNEKTGIGTGFVYPTQLGVHEWKVWWTEENKIEIEYAPHHKTASRWIFPVYRGKEELMAFGQWVVDSYAYEL